MRTVDRQPYHLFEMRGRYFVYDVAQRGALQSDRCAYAALQMRLDGVAPPAIRQRFTRKRFVRQHPAAGEKNINQKQESTLSIIAALFVLFTAMIAPPVSAAIAVILLVAFAIYKYRQSGQNPKNEIGSGE